MTMHRCVVGLLLGAAGLSIAGCSASAPKDQFADGVDRGPTPGTLHMMSRMLVDQREPEKAEYVLRRLIEETPSYSPAYVELAEVLAREGRVQDAIATLEEADARGYADAVVINNIGVLQLQAGAFDQAVQTFERATTLDAGEARYWSNLGVAFAMLGRDAEAATALSRCASPEHVVWNMEVLRDARAGADVAAVPTND